MALDHVHDNELIAALKERGYEVYRKGRIARLSASRTLTEQEATMARDLANLTYAIERSLENSLCKELGRSAIRHTRSGRTLSASLTVVLP